MIRMRKPTGTPTAPKQSRRYFLALGVMAMATSLNPGRLLARPRYANTPPNLPSLQRPSTASPRLAGLEKSLAFYNTNTGEKLTAVYWFRGRYLPESLRAINRLLRDHHSDEICPIDPQLLDLLYALGKEVDADQPFEVISAYRSPNTNSRLRQFNPSVAERSMHTEGKAVDLRLPGRDLATVRRAAVALQSGGVGYYSRFIHVDTGPVRYW
jgi:uncharacterized protein YcbK (DUF882 family)